MLIFMVYIQTISYSVLLPLSLQKRRGYLRGKTTLNVITVINRSQELLDIFDEDVELYFSIQGMYSRELP